MVLRVFSSSLYCSAHFYLLDITLASQPHFIAPPMPMELWIQITKDFFTYLTKAAQPAPPFCRCNLVPWIFTHVPRKRSHLTAALLYWNNKFFYHGLHCHMHRPLPVRRIEARGKHVLTAHLLSSTFEANVEEFTPLPDVPFQSIPPPLFALLHMPQLEELFVSTFAMAQLRRALVVCHRTFDHLHTLVVEGAKGRRCPEQVLTTHLMAAVVHIPSLQSLSIYNVHLLTEQLEPLPIPNAPLQLSHIVFHTAETRTLRFLIHLLTYSSSIASLEYTFLAARTHNQIMWDLEHFQAALDLHTASLTSCVLSVEGNAFPLWQVSIRDCLDLSHFPHLRVLHIATHFLDARLKGDASEMMARLPKSLLSLSLMLTAQPINMSLWSYGQNGAFWDRFPHLSMFNYAYTTSTPLQIHKGNDWKSAFHSHLQHASHTIGVREQFYSVEDDGWWGSEAVYDDAGGEDIQPGWDADVVMFDHWSPASSVHEQEI